jgi:lysophospholipase L1-like esterase
MTVGDHLRERPSSSRVVARVLLVVSSFLVCAACAEVGLRLFYGNNPRFVYPQVQHELTYYGYKPRPNQRGVYTTDKVVRTNAFGFRDHEWTVPKPAGRTRVMVVGDSFTFGNALDQENRYTDLLDARLHAVGDVEVINASAGGWNLDNESAFLRTEALQYEPDALVLAFVINDWVPNGYDRSAPVKMNLSADGRLDARPSWLRWLPYPVIFWLKSPALVAYLRDRVAAAANGDSLDGDLISNRVDLEHNEYVVATFAELGALKQWSEAHRLPMILLAIPPVNLFWVPRDSPAYLKYLAAFCERQGIGFVDPSPAFWSQKNPTKLYMYPWDNHLAAAGHRLVADQLYPVLATQLRAVTNHTR